MGVVRYVRVQNPSGGTVLFTMSVGTDAAGTRIYDAEPIGPGQALDWVTRTPIESGESLVAYADVTNTLTMTVSGEERPSSIPFSPIQLANLVAWYKADSIAQLDNTDVLLWIDSSGNGRDLATSGGTPPKFRTGIVGALPIIRYTGGSSSLFRAGDSAFALDITKGFSYAAAIRFTAQAAFMGGFTNVDQSSGGDYGLHISAPDTIGSFNHAVGGYVGVISTPVNSTVELYEYDYDLAGHSRFFHHNVQEGPDLVVPTPDHTSALHVGLFYFNPDFGPVEADICELVFCQRQLTDPERTALDTYLASKW